MCTVRSVWKCKSRIDNFNTSQRLLTSVMQQRNMGVMTAEITDKLKPGSTVCLDKQQRKSHFALLARVCGIHCWPVDLTTTTPHPTPKNKIKMKIKKKNSNAESMSVLWRHHG